MKKTFFSPVAPENWWRAAVVGGPWSRDFHYTQGFLDAAKILADSCLKSDSNIEKDSLVFPICFNFRHYVELSLKDGIRDLEKLGAMYAYANPSRTSPVAVGVTHGHSLEKLLQLFEARLGVVSHDELPPAGRKLLVELHNLDPDGQTFRYAEKITGAPSMPVQRNLDVEILRRRMLEIEEMFDGFAAWLEHQISTTEDYLTELSAQDADYQAEMQAEFASDMADLYDDCAAEHYYD